MNISLLTLFMPYCVITKDGLFCLCNRKCEIVFAGKASKPISKRQITWINDGLLLRQQNGAFLFYLYEKHPEYLVSDPKVENNGFFDPSVKVKYFLRLNRLMYIIENIDEQLDKNDPQILELYGNFYKKQDI